MNAMNAPDGDKSIFKREIAVIPRGAYVAATIIFFLVPTIFWTLVWPSDSEQHTPLFLMLIPMVPATFLAVLALMIGYVNRDAGRRGMSRTKWTLIVTFVPNAIGFILYFLMRNPIRTQCPKCGSPVDASVNYCPKCRYSFHATCAQCKTPFRPGDTFCGNCGAQIEQA